MIPVWDVQTFYGTHQKTFQYLHNAEAYYRELCQRYDSDLVVVQKRLLTQEEFILENIDD